MLLPLDADETELIETARAVFRSNPTPPALARRPGLDERLWKQIADLGWLGVAMPERHGGSGGTFAHLGLVLEEVGRALAMVPLTAHVSGCQAILHHGTDQQREEFLPQLTAGSRRVALGVSGHLDGVQAAEATSPCGGQNFALCGVASTVLGAAFGDLILLSAESSAGVGLFVVHSDSTVTCEPREGLDLRRDIGTLTFDETPAVAVGASPSSDSVETACAVAVIAMACESAGAAARNLDWILAHLKTREQFGGPIGTFQALKHRCATLFVESTASTTAARLAAREVPAPPPHLLLAAAVAKMTCSSTLLHSAMECVQMHGAIGYSWEFDAHLYLRRAKSDQHLLGTALAHSAKLVEALGVSLDGPPPTVSSVAGLGAGPR